MSTIARIGQIPYLNCEPFYHGLDLEGIELCPMAPRAMGPLAQAERLDAAPFSLVQCFGLEELYEPLGNLGIAVTGPVKSILFYSRVPLGELSGATVGITGESATSVQLMRLLLEQRYRVRPREYVPLDSPQLDALLLIGDEALLTRNHVEGFPHRYDLAEEWLSWQGLPFVFALWMARRSLEQGVKEVLARRLRERVEGNLSCNLEAIAAKRAYMGMSPKEVMGYLRAFRYVLADEDRQAIQVFKEALSTLSPAREATP